MTCVGHLPSARRLILAAMDDPDRAAAFLDEAACHLDAVLRWASGPAALTPAGQKAIREAEELWAIMRCLETEEAA